MLLTRIKAYEKGLVFNNGRYKGMLNEGVYWTGTGKVLVYDMQRVFNPPIQLNILLKDEELKEALHVVEVKDNEIAVRLDNGLFKQILPAGRYCFWKGIVDHEFIIVNLNEVMIDADFNKAILTNPELLSYIRVYHVEAYEKALLYIDGKLDKVLEPGVYHYWKNMSAITVQKADMRQQQMEINGQEILTKDKAALRINFFVHYRVADILKSLFDNKDFDKQLHIIMQMVLRQYIGGYTLDELLDKRNELSSQILSTIKEKTTNLGLTIQECGIRDIILPGDVRDIMNRVMIAEKQAQANTITRREETASTRSLLNTAKLMEENQVLLKLKEMEYVERIADKISNISISGAGDVLGQLKQVFVPVTK